MFLVKSMYLALKFHHVNITYKNFWLARIILRVKCFLWLVFRNSMLTKENMVTRGQVCDENL